MMRDFKDGYREQLSDLGELSNTKYSFDLLSPNLLKSDSLLIHYTDHPEDIATYGFIRGMPYISMLGETVRTNLSHSVGYNFAYLKSDSNHSYQEGGFKKKGYVVFRSPGVYVQHHGDRDRQVIFWGGYVKKSQIVDYGYL